MYRHDKHVHTFIMLNIITLYVYVVQEMHGGNNLMTTAFVNYLFTSFEHYPADG